MTKYGIATFLLLLAPFAAAGALITTGVLLNKYTDIDPSEIAPLMTALPFMVHICTTLLVLPVAISCWQKHERITEARSERNRT